MKKAKNAVSVVLVLSLLAALAGIFYVVNLERGEPLTEFYIVGAGGKAEGYPLNISAGEIGAVTVGVVNREFKDIGYLLIMSYEGVDQKKPITLKDSEKWEERFNFTFNNPGKHKVEFLLYNDGEESYRRLHLWIDVRD